MDNSILAILAPLEGVLSKVALRDFPMQLLKVHQRSSQHYCLHGILAICVPSGMGPECFRQVEAMGSNCVLIVP